MSPRQKYKTIVNDLCLIDNSTKSTINDLCLIDKLMATWCGITTTEEKENFKFDLSSLQGQSHHSSKPRMSRCHECFATTFTVERIQRDVRSQVDHGFPYERRSASLLYFTALSAEILVILAFLLFLWTCSKERSLPSTVVFWRSNVGQRHFRRLYWSKPANRHYRRVVARQTAILAQRRYGAEK